MAVEDSVADEIIQSAFRRWSNLEDKKDEVSADMKELMAELKGQGLDPKIARAAFRAERLAADAGKAAEVEETEALVDLYRAALARNARKEAA
ncbi:GapR family DNA-binding domain-containing protein [Devosia sp. MC1541]|uniref:GapR family DNA-binding domain-containing protein n=1 Tax=Devosia sp. MC1541 TaxID=2725264 RepID=UPI00145D70B9|nr:GapR family DNA-binding domain-containing protein [Devosia sp. MC1541]